MKFKAVMFDVIGTAVQEKVPETIMNCFREAFLSHGIIVDEDFLRLNRGKDKVHMIAGALSQGGYDQDIAVRIYDDFKRRFKNRLDNFCLYDGANELFLHLRKAGVKIGLGSGLSRDLFDAIYEQLDLKNYTFDYIGISEEVGRPRPHPDMLLDMIRKAGLANHRELLKVGDTIADIEEGKNAGVTTAVILSGTQPEATVTAAKPDYIFRSIYEVSGLFIE